MAKTYLENNMIPTEKSEMQPDRVWTVMKMKAQVQGILGNTNYNHRL